MAGFMVLALLGMSGRAFQSRDKLIFGDQLDVAETSRDGATVEALSVVAPQGLDVCEQPGLHRLDHRMAVFVGKLQSPPRDRIWHALGQRCANWSFGVDEEHTEGGQISWNVGTEQVKRFEARPSHDDLKPDVLPLGTHEQLREELMEALTQSNLRLFLVTSALDINAYLVYQRVPPSSPDSHNSPREQSLSQSFN